ncbi:MAG: ISLre2 family transposase [Abditibacteriota bacterium]|nr:ISLre2 family transposase [Abditibacteriota bacterium]
MERHGDKRTILTTLGEVEYGRTYYRTKEKEYCYPVDAIAGVESRQRLAAGVNEELVRNACAMSYGKSVQNVTGNRVSRQTVMNKVRESHVPPTPKRELRIVSVLHIDADEDHVTLCGGKNAIVPLVSVYEGIEKHGKRGECANVFHIGSYGKKTEDIWDEVLTELEKRYDLSETTIYLHGDGANWIHSGLEYLPNAVFVLDPYHKNKYLRQSVRDMGEKSAKKYKERLFSALRDGDKERFAALSAQILKASAKSAKKVEEALNYLSNHFDAIHIRYANPEARNGGATEPHISHILSSRLSSRPMAWSEQTLKHLVPVLAAGQFVLKKEKPNVAPSAKKTSQPKKRKAVPFSLGLPDPAQAVSLPARSGKVTPLFNALRSF